MDPTAVAVRGQILLGLQTQTFVTLGTWENMYQESHFFDL
jgi:hypothetical protein